MTFFPILSPFLVRSTSHDQNAWPLATGLHSVQTTLLSRSDTRENHHGRGKIMAHSMAQCAVNMWLIYGYYMVNNSPVGDAITVLKNMGSSMGLGLSHILWTMQNV